MTVDKSWIEAEWDAPAHVRAGTTTRLGGMSQPPFDTLNLAKHVGDDTRTVDDNREILQGLLGLSVKPQWLHQLHGNQIITIQHVSTDRQADGSWCDGSGGICAVLTADCLPLLLCDRAGRQVAAVHIGWRGFSKNIVNNAINRFSAEPRDLLAWIGPTISAEHYEVGDGVRTACLTIAPAATSAFTASRRGHWFADLRALVKEQLASLGVAAITEGDYCTYSDNQRFYSYRRNGVTGRTACLIWREP